MSLLTWRDTVDGQPSGPVWYLEFDATLLEEFSRSADVTIYPVETGAVLADHYQPQPRAITVTGVVSNTPIQNRTPLEGKQDKVPGALGFTALKQLQSAAAAQRAEGIVTGPVVSLPGRRLIRGNVERSRMSIPQTAMLFQFGGDVTRIADVFLVIDDLMQERIPVNVLMFDELEFTNMMITNHRAPHVAGAAGSVEFTLNLLQVSTADTASGGTTAAEVRKEPKHKSNKDNGKGNGKPLTAKDKARIRNKLGNLDPSTLPDSLVPFL
jgi:hypothetical protein